MGINPRTKSNLGCVTVTTSLQSSAITPFDSGLLIEIDSYPSLVLRLLNHLFQL